MTRKDRFRKNNQKIVRNNKEHGKPNYALILIVAILLIYGLLMIFSASNVIAVILHEGDSFFFVTRQLLWIFIGMVCGYIVYRTPFRAISRYGTIIFLFGSILLMLIILPEAIFNIDFPFVETINGATRWINLGFISIQPSEMAKLGMIIFMSRWYTLSVKKRNSIEKSIESKKENQVQYALMSLIYRTLPFLIFVLYSVFILAQKDLDTIIIIGLIFLSIYYLSNNGTQHTLRTIGLLLFTTVMGIVATLSTPFRQSRLRAFLEILFSGEPSEAARRAESFQVWNGLLALGIGGITGVGFGQSRQKLFYLQEAAYTDSIFAIIGEEFGLLGTLSVIFGFLFILFLGIRIAKNAQNKFQYLMAIGITSWITIQAFLNIAANLSIIPFGGMPLPFFTYGGSNTIMMIVAVAILLKISKYSKKT